MEASPEQETPRRLCPVCTVRPDGPRALRRGEKLVGFDIEPYDDLVKGERDATAMAYVLKSHFGKAACVHGRRLNIRGRTQKLRRIGRALKVAAKEIGSKRLRIYAHAILETGPFQRSRVRDITNELL